MNKYLGLILLPRIDADSNKFPQNYFIQTIILIIPTKSWTYRFGCKLLFIQNEIDKIDNCFLILRSFFFILNHILLSNRGVGYVTNSHILQHEHPKRRDIWTLLDCLPTHELWLIPSSWLVHFVLSRMHIRGLYTLINEGKESGSWTGGLEQSSITTIYSISLLAK